MSCATVGTLPFTWANLPDKRALFPTEGNVRMATFIHHWTVTQRHLSVFKTLAADIWDALNSQD
jgi:hypothetical protein